MPAYSPNVTNQFAYFSFLNIDGHRAGSPFTTFNMYVNSVTGSNSGNRGGSPSSPFKDLQFAIRDALTMGRDAQVVIHLSGAADHTMPDGYVFSNLFSPDQVTNTSSAEASADSGFNKRAPIVIKATPTTLATILGASIVSQTNDADSGLKIITTLGGLTPNAFDGKWGKDANNVLFRIKTNTAAVIDLCYAGIDLTAPLTIYSESATIAPLVPASSNPTVVIRGSTVPIVFEGIIFEASNGGAVQLGPNQQAMFVGCTLANIEMGAGENASLVGGGAAAQFTACEISNITGPQGALVFENCHLENGTFSNFTSEMSVTASACAAENMLSPLFSDGSNSVGRFIGTNLSVETSVGSGIHQKMGFLSLSECDIASNGTNGLLIEGNAFAGLSDVSSSAANGEIGLKVADGALVEVNAGTDVAGTLGDLQAGELPDMSWVSFRLGASPFALRDYAQGCGINQGSLNGAMPAEPITVFTTTPVTARKNRKNIIMDATAGAAVVPLPPLASCLGQVFMIKKVDATANTVTVDGDGAETIDGLPTFVITAQYEAIQVIAGPTEWHIF